nr:hypothetical protein [Tanacetum cinerariifolium]
MNVDVEFNDMVDASDLYLLNDLLATYETAGLHERVHKSLQDDDQIIDPDHKDLTSTHFMLPKYENKQLASCPAIVIPGIYYSDDKLP